MTFRINRRDGTPPDQDFDFMLKMGEGSYGTVWKAREKRSSEIGKPKTVVFAHFAAFLLPLQFAQLSPTPLQWR